MKEFLRIGSVAPVLLGCLLLAMAAGCGERAVTLSDAQKKSFDSAPASVKETWDKALAADKSNDYVNAQTAFDNLGQMTLSDAQRQALDAENNAFGKRLMDALDKNDPAAAKAVQEINKSRSRRK